MQLHQITGVAAVAGVFALSGCSAMSQRSNASDQYRSSTAAGREVSACEQLRQDPRWYGDNRERLDEMMKGFGRCGGDPDVTKGAPLALFDWDNTVVKNDIGDAMTYWMLANGKVHQAPNRDWRYMSSYLTDAGAGALNTACGPLAEADDLLPTNTPAGSGCADEILAVYGTGRTTAKKTAFQNFNARRIEPGYAFAAQLLQGWTTREVKDMARQSRQAVLTSKEGALIQVGSQQVVGWVRYYDEITNLISTLRHNGIDARIISASSEPVAEVWAESLGLTADRVMGVKVEVKDDRLTTKLASCGGDSESIPYIEGKRCRVNQEIFHIRGKDAWNQAPTEQRQVFGAGDSDTDVTFLSDATALRLAINRNKMELMCNAYANRDSKWLINPMFIDPAPQRAAPYPCSTAGYILPNGGFAPLLEKNGEAVPNMMDTVF